MSTSCRSHRPADRAIHGAAEAIKTVRLATNDGTLNCVLVACVDADRLPLTMFIFDGRAELDEDLELAVDAVIAAAASQESPLAALFLASCRPDGEVGPTPADERRWGRMADRCLDAGIEPLDWFLIDRNSVCSVAEGLNPGPGW